MKPREFAPLVLAPLIGALVLAAPAVGAIFALMLVLFVTSFTTPEK